MEVNFVGELIKFKWSSDDGSWRIGSIRVPSDGDYAKNLEHPDPERAPWRPGSVVTVVGDFGEVERGELLQFWGTWDHSDYGWQVKLQTCLPIEKNTLDAVASFLASDEVKGIGPALAEKITNTFGEEVAKVIEDFPERLTEISGISDDVARNIHNAWVSKAGLRRVVVFFAEYGVDTYVSRRAFKSLGVDVIRRVKENPYALLKAQGIGFKLADDVARKMGIGDWDERRLKGALGYVCNDVITKNGHTSLLQGSVVYQARKLLCASLGGVQEPKDLGSRLFSCIDQLVEFEQLVRMRVAPDCVLVQHPRYTRAEKGLSDCIAFEHESAVVDRIGARMNKEGELGRQPERDEILAYVEGVVEDVCAQQEITLSDEQRHGVVQMIMCPFTVVTGGPGTGKTTVLRTALQAYRFLGIEPLLCSPTGKAATRMSEVTKAPAVTVHRALAFNPGLGGFQFGDLSRGKNQLPDQAVIIDEASMLDARLAWGILSAVAPGNHITLVGDVDQLPSVGPGNVLRDVIDSGYVPVTRLTKVFRQGEGSGVVAAAHQLLHGEVPQPADDMLIDGIPPMAKILDRYMELVKDYGMENVQVLIPQYKGDYGIDRVNELIQERMTSRNQLAMEYPYRLYVGDRVIQGKNDYELGVVNGDVGFILEAGAKGKMVVEFDGVAEPVTVTRKRAMNLRPAYAVSVHKSQGSEYAAVLIILHRSHSRMQYMNLVYTAITRAKKVCHLYGGQASLQRAATTKDPTERVTTIAHWTELKVRGEIPAEPSMWVYGNADKASIGGADDDDLLL